jgi:hypothetical protein
MKAFLSSANGQLTLGIGGERGKLLVLARRG